MTKTFKQALLGAAATIALGSFAGPAHAGLVTFTWDPTQAGAGGVSAPITNANNANIGDFAYASITTGGAHSGDFTESGVILITQFLNGIFPVVAPGLNTNYGLYLTFSTTGHLSNWPGAGNPLANNYTGTINSLSYSFIIDPTHNDTIHDSGSAFTLNDPTSNDVTLATGAKTAGQNTVSLDQGTPTAHATATWIPTGTDSGFFVAPPASKYLDFDLQAAFTNTGGVSTLTGGAPTILEINGGGGNIDFVPSPVPEPASLSIFGAALFGLGFASMRRRKS